MTLHTRTQSRYYSDDSQRALETTLSKLIVGLWAGAFYTLILLFVAQWAILPRNDQRTVEHEHRSALVDQHFQRLDAEKFAQ